MSLYDDILTLIQFSPTWISGRQLMTYLEAHDRYPNTIHRKVLHQLEQEGKIEVRRYVDRKGRGLEYRAVGGL